VRVSPTTASPTVSSLENDIDNGTCVDDPLFKYRGSKKCKWLAKVKNNPASSEKRCNIVWDGKPIKESCPEACGLCEEKNGDATMPPTGPPTASPTKSYVVGNDNDSCIDNPDYRYKGVKKCSWIANNTAKRCGKQWEGKVAKESCRATCNVC